MLTELRKELLELGIGEGSRSLPVGAGASNRDEGKGWIGELRPGQLASEAPFEVRVVTAAKAG